MTNFYDTPYHGPLNTRTVTRFVKPTAWRFAKTLFVTLGAIYVVSIPLTWYYIQASGLGGDPNAHLSAGGLLIAIAMVSFLWAPLFCLWCSPALIPLAAVISFGVASIRRVSIIVEPSRPHHSGPAQRWAPAKLRYPFDDAA